MIHTLTAYGPGRNRVGRETPDEARRTFGYFHTRAEAIDAVARNASNMHECLYTHLVVEAIAPGVHGPSSDEVWFCWDEDSWSPCVAPEWAMGIVNHGLG